MASLKFNEAPLRHPWERPIFIASVLLNLALMIVAVVVASKGSDWLEGHRLLEKSAKHIRTLAFAALFAPPAITIIRNLRRGFIRGNAIRLSPQQVPQLYALLEKHCAKLGVNKVPELYLSEGLVHDPAHTFSVRQRDFIVLSKDYLERKPERTLDVMSFMLGRELGRIRLGHTKWWYELLLSYVIKIPYLMNAMTQVQTLSHDRYGAFLEPDGLRGLIIQASGRRVLKLINIEDYLRQVQEYRGFWAGLADLTRKRPHVSYRIQALYKAGFFQPASRPKRLARGTAESKSGALAATTRDEEQIRETGARRATVLDFGKSQPGREAETYRLEEL